MKFPGLQYCVLTKNVMFYWITCMRVNRCFSAVEHSDGWTTTHGKEQNQMSRWCSAEGITKTDFDFRYGILIQWYSSPDITFCPSSLFLRAVSISKTIVTIFAFRERHFKRDAFFFSWLGGREWDQLQEECGRGKHYPAAVSCSPRCRSQAVAVCTRCQVYSTGQPYRIFSLLSFFGRACRIVQLWWEAWVQT